jgi:Fasciclin domain
MKHRSIAAALAAATALGLGATSASAASHASSGTERLGNRSLATVLGADGNHFDHNWRDFDIADRAVHTVLGAKPGSPVGVLADGTKRLTAFVPTDRAFRRLAHDLTGARPKTEKGTFAKLAKKLDVNTWEAVLLYHVVPGAPITYRQAKAADGAKLMTAAGGKVTVDVRHGTTVRLLDADKNDRNPKVLSDLVNINKGNKQIAHGINLVLRPVDLP